MNVTTAIIVAFICAISIVSVDGLTSRQIRLLNSLLSTRPFASQPQYQILTDDKQLQPNLYQLPKRSGSKVMFTVEEEICPVKEGWQRLSTAKNFSNKVEVSLMQSPIAQWIYTAQCDPAYEDQKCRLIPEGYETRCETRESHIHALVNGVDGAAHWTIIDVPASCVCVHVKKAEFVRRQE